MLVVGAVVLIMAAGLAMSQDKASQSTQPKLTAPHEAQAAAPAGSLKAADNLPVIGYLEKRDRTITIKAGPKGPVYSVKTADGKVLCENLSADQLRAQAPELSEFFKTAVAGAAGANKADARLRVTMDASLERTTRR
jgi:hypothetical protein